MIDQTPAVFKFGASQGFRVAVIGALLFLLLAANNLIKILRDSIFLGHHSVSELPYLYISVALCAGVIIAVYARYTVQVSMVRLILATNTLIVVTVAGFWLLFTYIDPGWSHYAFYIWSAMITVVAVSQVWTLANHVFTPEEGRQAFGLIAASGTIGGVAAGFGAKWSIHLSLASNHLLWVVAGIYLLASVIAVWAENHLVGKNVEGEISSPEASETALNGGVGEVLNGSGYLKTIAVIILVSVVVSTLIDFHFKNGAKQAYPSTAELAAFFSVYYGWLNIGTLFAQILLTSRALRKFGLGPSLNLTPGVLLSGSVAMIIWPGLVAPMLTRMADTIFRNSIHRSGMELTYMAVPARVVKAVKTFLDVVVERAGDAAAGLIILTFSYFFAERYIAYVHLICVGLIIGWLVLNRLLQAGYSDAFREEIELGENASKRSWVKSE